MAFYFDVHMKRAIADQLRRRGVDVLDATDDARGEARDDELLARAHELGRVMVTQDKRFKGLAESWQRQNKSFSGLAFAPQMGVTIGRLVIDLELVAKATDPEDWRDVVQHLPL